MTDDFKDLLLEMLLKGQQFVISKEYIKNKDWSFAFFEQKVKDNGFVMKVENDHYILVSQEVYDQLSKKVKTLKELN